MQLRPYQQQAVDAVYEHLRNHDDNPCVVIPTAGGKTPIISTICKDAVTRWDGRVLILAHVKELLEQAADKLRAVCPELEFGIYSAGLKRRDTDAPVIVAGIQSVYRRACDLGPFDLILVDEAHLIPTDGEGMYRRFLADAKVVNPHVRVAGFTATPFRLGSGLICSPDNILNQVCFEVGVRELIVQGYLCPLVSKAGTVIADTGCLHIRGGEFVAGEVEELMDTSELVEAACAEIVQYTQDRNAVLIFATGVQHARHVQQVLQENHGVECGLVTGDTPADERKTLLRRFKAHPHDHLVRRGDVEQLKYLVNVNVLTTGFDAPNVDCVALLRPTMSPGLYYQMVGRGFRLHHSKRNCLVLDFGENVLRHGPVDAVRPSDKKQNGDGPAPAKKCPECNSVIAAGYSVCPDCGYSFPPPDRKQHEAKASDAGVLSDQVTDTEYEVRDVIYRVHQKRDAPPDAPKTMRVDYMIGLDHWQSEWVCFEHTGFARQKAIQWWRRRSRDPVPDTAERAVEIAEGGGLAMPEKITVRSVAGEKYDRIVGSKLGPLPEPVDAFFGYDPDEIPF